MIQLGFSVEGLNVINIPPEADGFILTEKFVLDRIGVKNSKSSSPDDIQICKDVRVWVRTLTGNWLGVPESAFVYINFNTGVKLVFYWYRPLLSPEPIPR